MLLQKIVGFYSLFKSQSLNYIVTYLIDIPVYTVIDIFTNIFVNLICHKVLS